MEQINLKKLARIWNPFNQTVWIKLNTPITIEEIQTAINEKRFISPETPKKMFLIWDESTREEHIERIAWLVVNFDENFPIQIEFGIPGICGFELSDGNHRLAAALFLKRPYINSESSGAESEIKKYLFQSNTVTK